MHKNLIGGEWVAGSKSQPNINPSDTRDVIGEYAQANVEQARHAIAAASHAFRAWSVTTPQQRLKVGDARSTDTQVGPVVDQTQLEQDLEYVRIGQDEGANLLCGGEHLRTNADGAPGFYFQPAVFVDTSPNMRINREEIFGPVVSVLKARDYEEALMLANDSEFGLAAGIATTSLKSAAHFKRHMQAGMVMVNLPTAGVDYHVPFGGRKGSSYGPREQGRYAAEFHTTVKTAYTNA